MRYRSDYIPSVYQYSKSVAFADGALRISTDLPHELHVGDQVKFYLADGSEIEKEVLVVHDETAFTIESENEYEAVFVFGKLVSDFRTVDYDAIAMLNVSATQELLKEVERQQLVIESLNKSLAELLEEQEKRAEEINQLQTTLKTVMPDMFTEAKHD